MEQNRMSLEHQTSTGFPRRITVADSLDRIASMYKPFVSRRNFLRGVGALALGGVATQLLNPGSAEASVPDTTISLSTTRTDAVSHKEEEWQLPSYVRVLLPLDQVAFDLHPVMQSVCGHLEHTGLRRYIETLDIARSGDDERLRFHPSRHAEMGNGVYPQAVTIPGTAHDTIVYAGDMPQPDRVQSPLATLLHETGHMLHHHYTDFIDTNSGVLEVSYKRSLERRLYKATSDFSVDGVSRLLTPYVASIVEGWWYKLGMGFWNEQDNTNPAGSDSTPTYLTPDQIKAKIAPYLRPTKKRLFQNIPDTDLPMETHATPVSLIDKAMLWWYNNRNDLIQKNDSLGEYLWFDPMTIGRYLHNEYLENRNRSVLAALTVEQRAILEQIGTTVESEMFAEMYALRLSPGSGHVLAARHFPEANAFIEALLASLHKN